MMKIKLISDGTPHGTVVLLGDKKLDYVQKVHFSIGVGGIAKLNIDIACPVADVEVLPEDVDFNFYDVAEVSFFRKFWRGLLKWTKYFR